ncbi:PDC sensor domain-containing protein [Paenibacillus hexagrammi]|uniref:Cache domain-containing protein n=1 Tax=Paenibacillus hexagrammi TaxID=2908839 RepID=A0ABY3SPM8_9BACL|nr:cache domain-containing protein [Paenibacillus sp. YPD9-1]UJF35480.1 hypothetical protein L0M14_10465 [Paenibacillus sp. YPD9-1]
MRFVPSFIRQIVHRFMRLRFRTKMIIFYVMLISIPSILTGFLHYNTSLDIILNNSRESMKEIVKKNNEMIDMILQGIEERTLSLNSDPDLYDVFEHLTDRSDYNLVKMDKRVTMILNKYFSQNSDHYSAQLVTSYYSFGGSGTPYTTNSPFFSVSPEGFRSSDIYSRVAENRGKFIWIPTYDYTKTFNQYQLQGLDPKIKFMFSGARVINSAPIVDGVIHPLDPSIERPVLLINFTESFYREILKFSTPLQGSYLYVVSDKGDIVYHPDTSKLATIDTNGYLEDSFQNKSGTMIKEINGEKMLICFETSKVTGWKTVSVVPYKQLVGELPMFRSMELFVAAGLTILAMLAAYIFSGWMTKPIKKLIVATHITGNGDFTTKIPEQADFEFGILIKKI